MEYVVGVYIGDSFAAVGGRESGIKKSLFRERKKTTMIW